MISRRIWEMHGSGRSTVWAKAAGVLFVLWWATCCTPYELMNTRRRSQCSDLSGEVGWVIVFPESVKSAKA